MIELVLVPWSPYCLVQQRILEYSGAKHRLVRIPSTDRSLVWRLTRQRYYQVPIIKHGATAVFEIDDNSQVIAKYLDSELGLGLFPAKWEGVQKILWRYIDNEVEGVTFRLNDVHCREFVPPSEYMNYIRHKERKFGRGCIARWRSEQKALQRELAKLLLPFEQMLIQKSFLLDEQPRFVDFDLWGMMANLLFTGHYRLPRGHTHLRRWYERMTEAKFAH